MSTVTPVKVLVVDDSAVNQKVAVAMLDRLGYPADVADNGLVALEMVAERPYALVLMDCQMPRMDGYEATAQIRRHQNGTHTPIVALTASEVASNRVRCLAAGMDDYLAKPLTLDELTTTLETWITRDPLSIRTVPPERADEPTAAR